MQKAKTNNIVQKYYFISPSVDKKRISNDLRNARRRIRRVEKKSLSITKLRDKLIEIKYDVNDSQCKMMNEICSANNTSITQKKTDIEYMLSRYEKLHEYLYNTIRYLFNAEEEFNKSFIADDNFLKLDFVKAVEEIEQRQAERERLEEIKADEAYNEFVQDMIDEQERLEDCESEMYNDIAYEEEMRRLAEADWVDYEVL